MGRAVRICNPGETQIPEAERELKCTRRKCGHAKVDHWWGGGDCAECDCEWFLPVAKLATR